MAEGKAALSGSNTAIGLDNRNAGAIMNTQNEREICICLDAKLAM